MSSTPSWRLSWTRRLPLGTFPDDPQDARAELPPVDGQGADHQVGALLGDEPAGADEQRRPFGDRRRGHGMRRRSAGMPASHQPTMILSSGTSSVRIRYSLAGGLLATNTSTNRAASRRTRP